MFRVKTIKATYLSENVAGDKLDVCVWDHPSDSDSLLFLILNSKKQSVPVFRCKIQFHDLKCNL